MKLSIRGKLFWLSVAVMLIVGSISGLFLEHRLKLWFGERLELELLRQARAAQALLRNSRTPQDFDGLADQLGAATEARITLIGHDGKVLGDSKLQASQLKTLPSHHSRPEILAARKRGKGISRRFSETLQTPMLYVALPFRSPPHRGFVRVAMPAHQIEGLKTRLRFLILFAGMLGMVVAVFISYMASFLVTRMLRRLLEHTQALASNASQELPALGTDEEGLVGSLTKITGRLEQTVNTLATERNRFEAVLENMNAAVLVIDSQQRVQLVNRSALSMMNRSSPPLQEKFSDLIESDELLALFEQVQSGEPASIDLKLKGPPEQRLLVRATPLADSGSTVMVIHDITELRRLERIRRDFVANVSHELRTPVSIIRANAETLLDGALEEPEMAQEFLRALLRHAERLSDLVSDLLDISRIEANEYHLETRQLPLAPALYRAHEAVEAILHNRSMSSTLEVDESLSVHADTRALEHILLNLLDNAIKYTPEGGHITLRSFRQGDEARVEVQDTGPGIPPKYRPRIFERFYRIDKGRSRDMGGTGLGLAIVKHLTEAQGGQVGVEPAEPHGSIFWFTLPLDAQARNLS